MYKTIDLALQGGGSHGAFTWGVLERLLEVRSLVIEGVCGTSAGAMNATIMAYGLHTGGRPGAIKLLGKFWKRIADANQFSLLRPGWVDLWLSNGRMDYSPYYYASDFFTQLFSPYQFNPLDYNPLKDLLEEFVDFEVLRGSDAMKLFICATNVRTARAKIFDNSELSAEAVLASACLPHLFKAIEIDGEAYWDGGYMGNPPIYPLIDNTETEDIMLVQINPIYIKNIPRTAVEIRDRVNTLSFNASLMHEMRRINFIQKNLHLGLSTHDKLRNLFIHLISPEEEMDGLGISSKYNTRWEFLLRLRQLGRKMADQWLEKNYDKLGQESTCNIQDIFL
ncbi:patatin-like phospholipase family protein [Eisenibacter elegans]|jgi:NTE family protein|uniref:patatin-like phospholipase family protein n=1 Tax=Eisenibacter elegans TaxID=997 RepID=UPI00041D93DE|nr:patatin-like phospholipase family protein [Eisenibacter elegans]